MMRAMRLLVLACLCFAFASPALAQKPRVPTQPDPSILTETPVEDRVDRERDRAPVAAPARGERDRERAPARGEHDRKREERHSAETGNTTSSGEHDRNAPVRASGDPNTSGDVMKATERHTLEENGNYILWWGSTLYLFMKCTLDEK